MAERMGLFRLIGGCAVLGFIACSRAPHAHGQGPMWVGRASATPPAAGIPDSPEFVGVYEDPGESLSATNRTELSLSRDGTFESTEIGCLGVYARATGTYTINSGAVLLRAKTVAPRRWKMITAYQRLIHDGQSYFVPAEEWGECSRKLLGEGWDPVSLGMLRKTD